MPGIREAIAASGALVVFVCNVATQAGETGGFDLADHVDALGARTAPATWRTSSSPTTGSTRTRRPAGAGEPVRLRWPPTGAHGPRLVLDDLVDPGTPTTTTPSASRPR